MNVLELRVLYGEYTMYKKDRFALKNMANFLGVSQECLRYRLDRLGLLDHKPYSEYDPIMNLCLHWEVNENE